MCTLMAMLLLLPALARAEVAAFVADGDASWVGFSPSGAHWAVFSTLEDRRLLIVDGRIVGESAAWRAAHGPVFDSETELHWLGVSTNGWVTLYCASLGDRSPRRGVCARKAAALQPRNAGDDE
ncbi:MAG: hypothetical protein A2V88_09640 [Elusimicrobia bacterium RBG_16_66_12]|nr:MAG: hypothetical protein A2V88_09640 [Elusimicrobia bacterium RBG_16_66_12]